MKRFWKFAGIATLIAILGVAAVGAVAYAQDDGEGFPFDFRGKFKETLAEILGVSVEEYDAAVDQAQQQVVDEALTEGWLTEDQAEMFRWQMDQAPGFGMRGMGKGFGEFDRGMFGRGDKLVSVAADELGMELPDLLTELQNGKSIADVAGEKGVDTQVIIDAYKAQVKEQLDSAVEEGRMTQKQADYSLQQAEEHATDQLDNTWEGGFRGFPGGGHPGRMPGFPGQDDA
jgi:polyhydroxyalkanoate synthesis regulator phasin